MQTIVVVLVVLALVGIVVMVELAAAVLPLLIVVSFVPPEQRSELADLLAAADSSRRLRLWKALHVAALARRRERDTRGQVGTGEAAPPWDAFAADAIFSGSAARPERTPGPAPRR